MMVTMHLILAYLMTTACSYVAASCDRSDWHLGYPDCGLKAQSPIDIAADLETVVKVSLFHMLVS